jgi:2'-hydroxyisoflavone reductase
MNLLILGGTIFLGRALVDAALAGGHTVTLFNRGRTNSQLYSQVETLTGQRDGGLAALEGRKWDAVIDTCGYLPRVVSQSAQLLSGSVDRYVFVSSISVYADASQPGVDEDAPVSVMADERVEEITGETYGALKALCEREVRQHLPGRDLIIRPGLIVGPYDPTDRFTYWPWRVAQGGEVLAPGKPERQVQLIDVRDLAGWTLRMVAAGQTGTFNADGPIQPLPMIDLLQACKSASQSTASFTWVGEKFLQEQHVQEWIEMPLWIPDSDPANAGFFAFSNTRALEAGLTFRPLEQTLRATLDWLETRPAEHAWRAGIPREREAELLLLWHSLLY